MKVLHTLDSLNRGGAETMELDVCRNAGSAGLDMTFVATGGGDLEQEFVRSGVDLVRLNRRLPIDPLLVWQLRRVIKDRAVRVVHAQQAVEAIHLYLATRGTGVKCVMTLHAYITDAKNRIATKLILPRMDAVVTVSCALREWYRTGEGFAGADRFHVVLNGVDVERLQPTRPQGVSTLRAELGIGESDKLLGMVGNFYLDARKDQLTVCRALPQVMQQIPSAHFVFVGSVHDGAEEYYKKCVNLCRDNGLADRVHFVGKRNDIPDVLHELDLFVFSSVQEGLPIAAVEALLLGVPMIVSDIPPLLEVIGSDTPEGACAEIFRTGDADDLAVKILDLLNDDARLRELGEKARSQIPLHFSIAAHIKSLRDPYEGL